MKRREFIILGSIGATLTACQKSTDRLIPALIPDEEYVPGLDYWKATSCAMCGAGCGLIVRTREHKANKVEGNPQHPINRGASCARSQAALQSLYNPDRLLSPMRRKRGSGQFEKITWEEALEELAAKLGEIKSQRGSAGFLTVDAQGVTGVAAEILASSLENFRLIDANQLNERWIRQGYEIAYEQSDIPLFDIARAHYLISFGARFLETWLSPVNHSLAFGEFRRASGKFVHVEPRLSLTAANADEWLPAAVGTESLVAMAIAQVIVREGLSKTEIKKDSLDDYAPEKTEIDTGIPAEKIIRIAREFALSQAALAIGSGTNLIEKRADAEAELKRIDSVHLLNRLTGNRNKPGGVLLPPPQVDPLARWRNKTQAWLPLTAGSISGLSALLVHQSNPLFAAPHTSDAIRSVPFIVSFSSFPDETSRIADLLLPDHTWLESWNIKAAPSAATDSIVNLTQPVVAHQLDTRQTADALLTLARSAGSSPPFENAEEIARQAMQEMAKIAGAQDEEEFRASLAERGLWTGKPAKSQMTRARVASAEVIDELSSLARPSNAADFPFILLTYEHPSLGFGEQANLPSLQELPDPMTGVIWGSWVEINPQTAEKLGLSDGDLIEVETPHGSLKASALIYPAIRPDVIAMPLGQGHQSMGRYAENRGVNPATINPVAAALQSDAAAVRAKITKLSERAGHIRFGTTLPERPRIER
ncbi:MAG: molybdopterin-dependent oxidoreductase [Acidobacteriota bacterium]